MARKSNGDEVRERIHKFIIEFMESNDGRSPTVQEIGDNIHKKSKSYIHYHLNVLEEQGTIEHAKHQARGLKILKGINGEALTWAKQTQIPVRGTIAAGQPLPNLDEPAQETITLGVLDAPKDAFALRIKGNSMIEDGIFDGDYLLVEQRQPHIENGTTVVAVHIDPLNNASGTATVKRFYREQSMVRLQPANSTMEPIYVPGEEWESEWTVRVKVIGLHRQYI
jgi:repressor LexA